MTMMIMMVIKIMIMTRQTRLNVDEAACLSCQATDVEEGVRGEWSSLNQADEGSERCVGLTQV